MTSISHLVLGTTSPSAAESFYSTAFGANAPIRAESSVDESTGFRGFTLGVDVSGAASVDKLFSQALGLGATEVKPPRKQLWGGYSGVLRTPDGTILKIATTAKKDDAPLDLNPERVVLLLGVSDVKVSKQLYAARGLAVAKSYGSKYVEFEQQGGAVTLGLYKRAGLAKEFGVPPEGSGSHWLTIAWSGESFTDPDGFVWVSVDAGHA
ncbi:hypothetical protein [Nocardia aobensis]|uniref:hypothetical protein n=1 Tax=Nocardia aobensis TaxID=257277 RepID=UPI00056B2F10|nr:hypothetical protein [Nocardia aobensis]